MLFKVYIENINEHIFIIIKDILYLVIWTIYQ